MQHNALTLVNTNILPFWLKAILLLSVVVNSCLFSVGTTFATWQATAEIAGNSVTTGEWISYGSIEITKYVCPEGTSVVRSVNGIGGVVPPTCERQQGAQFGYVHGTQTDANAPWPEVAVLPMTIGGVTDIDGILRIDNLEATGRYLISEIDGAGNRLANSEILGLYCEGDGDTSDSNDNHELTFVPANGVVKCVAYNLEGPEEPLACTAGPGYFDDFTLGSVHGQQGWSSAGGFDQEVVVNTYGFPTFGCQTLRIGNAVTSGSFADQTFSYSIVNEAGESDALNGGMSGGTRQNHFEAEFDIATALSTHQPGLFLSVSPDRGDGARMSYLSFTDSEGGIDVVFYDVQGTNDPANFVPTTVASDLSRTVPHTVKFEMDFVDGPSNDVVKIYIDGDLVHTGTSWENYFRFDDESNPGYANNNSRTVDSLIFRLSGTAVPANDNNGFLLDNHSLSSSMVALPVVEDDGVVLNEIFAAPQPSSEDPVAPNDREWIELYNESASSVDVLGWQVSELAGGNGAEQVYTIAASCTAPTSSKVVPYNGASTVIGADGLLTLEFCTGANVLNNGGDRVRLYDAGMTLVDDHSYPSTANGKSHARIPNGGTWVDPEPTPSGENLVTVQDLLNEGWTLEQITAVKQVVVDYEAYINALATATQEIDSVATSTATTTPITPTETTGGGSGGGETVLADSEPLDDDAQTPLDNETVVGGDETLGGETSKDATGTGDSSTDAADTETENSEISDDETATEVRKEEDVPTDTNTVTDSADTDEPSDTDSGDGEGEGSSDSSDSDSSGNEGESGGDSGGDGGGDSSNGATE